MFLPDFYVLNLLTLKGDVLIIVLAVQMSLPRPHKLQCQRPQNLCSEIMKILPRIAQLLVRALSVALWNVPVPSLEEKNMTK